VIGRPETHVIEPARSGNYIDRPGIASWVRRRGGL
jgi:hypothetical protein